MKKNYGNKLNYKILFMIIIFLFRNFFSFLTLEEMEIFGNNFGVKKSKNEPAKFTCELCDFNCCTTFNMDRHLLTAKHQNNSIGNVKKEQKEQKEQKVNICEICKKEFKTNAGLWKHKNGDKCVKKNIENFSDKKDEIIEKLIKENKVIKENEINKKDELIEYLMKENREIKDLILEICKNGVNNTTTTTTTHTNSHNKAFNIQFYLNETCKNAMNMSEFIESINLQLSDLISVGDLGYVDGISKIIIDNLNKLDATERPVNCTDKKRETFYIKDDDTWEKDEENKKLNVVVKKVALKNTKLFPKYKEKYPDYKDSESLHSDKYSKIVIESLKDDRENNDKVIKNISKVTTIKEK